MSVSFHICKKLEPTYETSDAYCRPFWKIDYMDEAKIWMSYSARADFCDIWEKVTGTNFPTRNEDYESKEAAKAEIIQPDRMFELLKQVLDETNNLQNMDIPNLDVAYMLEFFEVFSEYSNKGLYIIMDYA